MKNLNYYIKVFSQLNVSSRQSYPAPHKAILLLSVINLVQSDATNGNIIPLSEELVRNFSSNWRRYVGNSKIFNCNIELPYYHMQSEPFWNLVKDEYYEEKKHYSLNELRLNFKHAIIDKELYELLKDANNAATLTVLLITEYISKLYEFSTYSSIRKEYYKENSPNATSEKHTKETRGESSEILYSGVSVTVSKYNERSIVVSGSTKPIKDDLKDLGGIYNRAIYKGNPGWIFSIKSLQAVIEYLRRNETDTISVISRPSPKSELIKTNSSSSNILKNAHKTLNCKIEDSEGFKWAKEQLRLGIERKVIVREFNKRHHAGEKGFSTKTGLPLSEAILSHWSKL